MTDVKNYRYYLSLVVNCDKEIAKNPCGGYLSPSEWVVSLIYNEYGDTPYASYIVGRIFKRGGARDKLAFYSSRYFKGEK